MAIHSSSATPVQRMGPSARSRNKYSAARAFYLTIAVILVLAAWSFATDESMAPRGSSRALLPRYERATPEQFHFSVHGLARRDLEVHSFLITNLLLSCFGLTTILYF